MVLVTSRSRHLENLRVTCRPELQESSVVMGATLTILLLKLFGVLKTRAYKKLASFAQAWLQGPCGLIATGRSDHLQEYMSP